MTATNAKHLPTLPIGKGRLDVLPDYSIVFGDGVLLTLVVPFEKKPWEPWKDRATCGRPCTLLYKYGTRHGNRWEEREGFELEFTIPKAEVSVVVGQWYSYPRIVVGGVDITLNVSGGTDGTNWIDNISTDRATTSVDLPAPVLKAISAVALSRRFELQKSVRELEQEWETEHANELQVVSAFGSWAPWVPVDMVGVCACVGGHSARRAAGARITEVWALVPAQEYHERGSIGSFIVDPNRHHIFEGDPRQQEHAS